MRFFTCFLLFCSVTYADQPQAVVKGQKTVPTNGAVILDARDSKNDPDIPLQWSVVTPEDISLITADKDGRSNVLAIFVPPDPGTYQVALHAAGKVGVNLIISTKVWTVIASDPTPPIPEPTPTPNPQPGPPPVPNPTPTPAVITGTVWATAVFPKQLAMDLANLQLGAAIRQTAQADSINYRIFYDGDPELSNKNLTKYYDISKLPQIIIQQADGTVINTIPMSSQDQVTKYFNSLRGK